MSQAPTSTQISVRVLCFAQLRDQLGAVEVTVTLPAGATGHDLMAWCVQRQAALKPLLAVTRLAVNEAYVSWDAPLHHGDEAALLPPVSGG